MNGKYVYLFKEGNAEMREILGGKGANLAEMTNLGLPIPQGFTVSTEACNKYYDDGEQITEDVQNQIFEALSKLEEITGKKLGDKENPLFEEVENGICRVRAGEYEVAYGASQPLKRKYSIDSTMEELLNHPDIRAFLSQMMEVDMIPDIAYGLSLRDVAKTFAGEIKPEEAQMLDIALANF